MNIFDFYRGESGGDPPYVILAYSTYRLADTAKFASSSAPKSRRTRAGTPATSFPDGTRMPGGTNAPAATIDLSSTTAPSSTIAPIPMSVSSSTVHP